MLRQAVAALLNAAHPYINYPLSVGEVLAAVNGTLASGNAALIEALKNELEGYDSLGLNPVA